MLALSVYLGLLLVIALDNFLSVYKRVGHVGAMNRLSPQNQAIFNLIEFALFIAFAVVSIWTFGVLVGLGLVLAGAVFAFIFYLVSLRFFLKVKSRGRMAEMMEEADRLTDHGEE